MKNTILFLNLLNIMFSTNSDMRFTLFSLFIVFSLASRSQNSVEIQEMKWGPDFNIHITFSNDSTSIHDVKALYHATENIAGEVTYYPVSLDPTFIKNLKDKKLNTAILEESNANLSHQTAINQTLWSAINPKIGGGYIHFINSILYSFESGKLSLTAPLMVRPQSNWKPKPMTESYKRTKNWKYFAPNNQKLAQKEYKIQKQNNELGNIQLLPSSFISLFLNTSDKDYDLLIQNKEFNKMATIDMVKLMLGSKYLGKEQIDYIESSVIKSVMQYNINNLPSVIIFDNFDAAVAMTLDNNGYKIEKVVFNKEETLSSEIINVRLQKMEAVIFEINEVNKMVFEKKLKSYYTN